MTTEGNNIDFVEGTYDKSIASNVSRPYFNVSTSDVFCTELSYRELQAECKRIKVSAGGNTAELRQRLRVHLEKTSAGYDKENRNGENCNVRHNLNNGTTR